MVDWIRIARLVLIGGAALCAAPPLCLAQLSVPREFSFDDDPAAPQSSSIAPELDDATLRDVRFVSRSVGWAVGDRGVAWRTTDGGETWKHVPTPCDCTLTSVCILTDRVGWIAGRSVKPYSRLVAGVLAHTTDGGTTWQQQAIDQLPPLASIQFFDLKHGVAVGESTTEFPCGVLTTTDGGESWQSVSGVATGGWTAADFTTSATGVVIGRNERWGVVGAGTLHRAPTSTAGLRQFHAISIDENGQGCFVGDGGLLRVTGNAGITWTEPPRPLSRDVRKVIDFTAVARQGEHIWAAGRPGSVVWHSPDAGRSWLPQATGITSPLHAITFIDTTTGFAVGSFGTILSTHDAGAHWSIVRGGSRRAALLAVHAHPQSVSLNLPTRLSGEDGYRTVVSLITPPSAVEESELLAGIHHAQASELGTDWKLPINVPDANDNVQALVQAWNDLTDDRLREVLLSHLVRELRMWRPSVVVVDEALPRDAATELLNDAVRLAVTQAADPTAYPMHRTAVGLPPWQVRKLFRRLPPGSDGPTTLEPHQVLPTQGASLQMAAAGAYAYVGTNSPTQDTREAYQLVPLRSPGRTPMSGASFFAGIVEPPGGDARRQTSAVSRDDLERLQRRAQHQRNFQVYRDRYLDDTADAAKLIAQFDDILGEAPPDQAAVALLQLAEEYRQRNEWDLFESSLMELIRRFPDEPMAAQAMVNLIHLWGSGEMARLRTVDDGASMTHRSPDAAAIESNIAQLAAIASKQPGELNIEELVQAQQAATAIRQAGGAVRAPQASLRGASTTGRSNWSQRRERWTQQAVAIAKRLEQQDAQLFGLAEVQFPLASVYRSSLAHKQSDAVYRRFYGQTETAPWRRTAAGEVWLYQPRAQPDVPVITCRKTKSPPVLDGLLADECWQDADEFTIGSVTDIASGGIDDTSPGTIAFLMYDEKFLYFAARNTRPVDRPAVTIEMAGRTHDADLRSHDRLALCLDVDRDYTTFYRLDIDERGQTHDACWSDTTWDPKWFVYARGDQRSWSVEAAIPLAELVAMRPTRNTVWAGGCLRTIPSVEVQSWSHDEQVHPTATDARPEGFGLIRFE